MSEPEYDPNTPYEPTAWDCALSNFCIPPTHPLPLLFTKPRLLQLQSEFQRLDPKKGGQYTNHDLNGTIREQNATFWAEHWSAYPETEPKLCIMYQPYIRAPRRIIEEIAEIEKEEGLPVHCPMTIGWLGYRRHECETDFETVKSSIVEAERMWEGSAQRERIVQSIRANVKRMERVDRIVCFGLGDLSPRQTMYGPRSAIQHIAATTIRDALYQCRVEAGDVSAEKVKIFAQDPAYCDTCKDTLKNRWDIEVVDDPDGFLLVDKHTFVVTVSPDVAVRQVVMDVLWDEGGPAAFLCDEIEALPDYPEKMHFVTDPWHPRLSEYAAKCVEVFMRDESIAYDDDALHHSVIYLKTRNIGADGKE